MFKLIIKFSQFLEKIVTIFGKMGSWLSIPLMLIIIFDIVTRRFFILGSTKLQEMEWHLHSALFLLVLGYAYLKDSHVRIEIVREKYSILVKSIFEILGILLFLIPYTVLVIYYGIDFVNRSFNLNEVSSALTGLSHRWIIKFFIPFGMLLLLLAGVSILIKKILYIVNYFINNKSLNDMLLKINPELKDNIQEKKLNYGLYFTTSYFHVFVTCDTFV
jgi:TRAP-type mannitol/chloroaromatic compound transport system permease small subunit